MVDLSSQLADDKRNDIRIEAALAKLCVLRDGLADRRRAGPDPRRPRLRDRGVAGRPRRARRCPPSRCCATCGSTGSSRARPRSCTCSSPARRSTRTCRWPATSSSRAGADRAQGPGRRARPAASTPGGCPRWSPATGQLPGAYAEFGPLADAPAVRRAGQPQARPGRPSTGCRAGRASWSTSRASSAGSWTSAPSCSR